MPKWNICAGWPIRIGHINYLNLKTCAAMSSSTSRQPKSKLQNTSISVDSSMETTSMHINDLTSTLMSHWLDLSVEYFWKKKSKEQLILKQILNAWYWKHLNHRVKLQWMISSWMATYLSEGGSVTTLSESVWKWTPMSLSSSDEVLGRWVRDWESLSDVYGWIMGTWFELKRFKTQKWYLCFLRFKMVLQQSFLVVQAWF